MKEDKGGKEPYQDQVEGRNAVLELLESGVPSQSTLT